MIISTNKKSIFKIDSKELVIKITWSIFAIFYRWYAIYSIRFKNFFFKDIL